MRPTPCILGVFLFLLCCDPSANTAADPKGINVDPEIEKQYYDLWEEYRHYAMIALDPIPPDPTFANKARLADHLAGACAQSFVALCSSHKVVNIQQEMLNTLVEPDLHASPELINLKCKYALETLAIQFGSQGFPYRFLADQF